MFKKFKRFVSVMCLSLGLILSQSAYASDDNDFYMMGGNTTHLNVYPPSVTYTQPTFVAFCGAAVTLGIIPLVKAYGPEAWEKFKACLGRIVPARVTSYCEGIDLHHCLRKRSSLDMNISDLFLGKPDKASMSLLANLSRSLLEAGCKQYPVVYRELGGGIGDNEPLVGYQYTLEKHDKELASVVIVRAIPGRMPAKVDLKKVMDSKKEVDSEEDDGVKDIDVVLEQLKTPALTDDQKKSFYPLHPQLTSREVGLAGIEQLASRMLPDSEEHYFFSGTVANTMKNGKPTVVQGSSLKPLVEAKDAFYSGFSRIFAQPNVRDLLVTTFNQHLVEGKVSVFSLNTNGYFAHLELDGKNKISFDLYFIPHRISS